MAASLALVGDVERRAKLAACLRAANEMLTRATSAESAAAAIGRALLTLTDAPRAAVFFRSPTGVVICPWFHNLSNAYVRELITPDGINPWIHLTRHPELTCMDLPKGGRARRPLPWLIPDVGELPNRDTARRRAEREGLRSICAWPLSRAGRVIGAVAYYYDVPHVGSAPEQEIMRAFTAATAIHNGVAARACGQRTTDPEAGPATLTEAQAAPDVETTRLAAAQRALDSATPHHAEVRQGLDGERGQARLAIPLQDARRASC